MFGAWIILFYSPLFSDEIRGLSSIQSDKIVLPEYIPISSIVFNPFPRSNKSLVQPLDSMQTPRGIINFSFGQKKMEVHVSWDWSIITISETIDDRLLKIPFASSLDWYLKIMKQEKWHARQTEFGSSS